ncbi:MAG: hypothetical protein IJ045_07225 [Ruminiclostridium sp.]|nr:hypothetical protein [Ruminiclostridium sp.]
MKKNRLLSAALALAVTFSIAGCQDATTSSGTSQGGTSSVTENSSVTESGKENSDITSSNTESTDTSSAETTTENKGGNDKPVGVDGVVTNGQVAVTIDGHRWGISLYGGGTGENYAKYLNEFKEKVGSNVNVFNMVVPTASAFYLPAGYEEYNASHRDSINSIANNLVNVINIDGYAALEAKTDEYIYTRTDHHWMPLGAYYAAKAFCDVAMVPVKELSTYEPVDVEGFVGTMYAFTEYDEQIKNDPETFRYYIPSTDYTATYYKTDFTIDEDVKFFTSIFVEQPASGAYSTFMGGDQKIVKIETENKNGRKLCVFKDSYGNAEIPFFIDSFQEIYVCDVRYFDVYAPDFVKDNGITDVLFTMCTFSAVGENAEGIKNNLLTQ